MAPRAEWHIEPPFTVSLVMIVHKIISRFLSQDHESVYSITQDSVLPVLSEVYRYKEKACIFLVCRGNGTVGKAVYPRSEYF
jgi:hypothetical protein